MPVATPLIKVNAVRNFGGAYTEIVLIGSSYDEAYKASMEYCEKYDMIYIHPFDDYTVIEG